MGLLQALGVAVYCALVAGLFTILDESFTSIPPVMVMITFMLTLLVMSAAITGSIVFGYPTYLALNKNIKKALHIVAYTLLFLMGIIGATVLILALG